VDRAESLLLRKRMIISDGGSVGLVQNVAKVEGMAISQDFTDAF
jgi:hypothetical protein